MRTPVPGRVTGLLLSPRTLLLTVLAVLAGTTAYGHLVIMKDGYALYGTVKQQKDVIFDREAGLVEIAKLNGFFLVDDGCRRVIFSQHQVQEVEDKDLFRDSDVVRLARPHRNLDNFRVPGGSAFLGVTPFDDKWERDCKIEAPTGKITIRQRITLLTPHLAVVEG